MNFLSWLTLLLIGLKLTGYVVWPWMWVLAPVWIPLLIIGSVGFLLLAVKMLTD